MKFWQMDSIARVDAELIYRVAITEPNWKRYELLASNFPQLVESQDREALDSIVDKEFVVAVLGRLRRNLYLSSDNWLRSWQLNPGDQVISVLDAYKRYGADAVEDVFESGSKVVS